VVYCSIKILNSKIDEKSIDLIFADPPYNLSGNGLKWKGNKTGGDWYMVDEAFSSISFVNQYKSVIFIDVFIIVSRILF
jgi:DNA modification methylase